MNNTSTNKSFKGKVIAALILVSIAAQGCVGAGSHLSFDRTSNSEVGGSSSIPVAGDFNTTSNNSTLMGSENFQGVSGVGAFSGKIIQGTIYRMAGLGLASALTRLGR